jgi:hypothetical protein
MADFAVWFAGKARAAGIPLETEKVAATGRWRPSTRVSGWWARRVETPPDSDGRRGSTDVFLARDGRHYQREYREARTVRLVEAPFERGLILFTASAVQQSLIRRLAESGAP